MLLRVVKGRVATGRLTSVKASLGRTYVPLADGLAGLERYLIGAGPRPEGDGDAIAFMTLWTDIEAASAALGGRLTALRVLDGVGHGEVLERVDYYEVEIVEARRHPGIPRYLRLTAGTVGRGLDADIQRELRSRLGTLPDEVVEAYIGRRVSGQSVEIAFVSAWTEAAAVERLEQPVWPDISAQYDTFWIELFDVLLEGPAPG